MISIICVSCSSADGELKRFDCRSSLQSADLRQFEDVLDAVDPHEGALSSLLHGIPGHQVPLLIKQLRCCLQDIQRRISRPFWSAVVSDRAGVLWGE